MRILNACMMLLTLTLNLWANDLNLTLSFTQDAYETNTNYTNAITVTVIDTTVNQPKSDIMVTLYVMSGLQSLSGAEALNNPNGESDSTQSAEGWLSSGQLRTDAKGEAHFSFLSSPNLDSGDVISVKAVVTDGERTFFAVAGDIGLYHLTQRDPIQIKGFIGLAIDSFSTGEVVVLSEDSETATSDIQQQAVGGVTMDLRLFQGTATSWWVYGSGVFGTKSVEQVPENTQGDEAEELVQIIRNASTLEAYVGSRLELLPFGAPGSRMDLFAYAQM